MACTVLAACPFRPQSFAFLYFFGCFVVRAQKQRQNLPLVALPAHTPFDIQRTRFAQTALSLAIVCIDNIRPPLQQMQQM
jgi:hypothetical protein